MYFSITGKVRYSNQVKISFSTRRYTITQRTGTITSTMMSYSSNATNDFVTYNTTGRVYHVSRSYTEYIRTVSAWSRRYSNTYDNNNWYTFIPTQSCLYEWLNANAGGDDLGIVYCDTDIISSTLSTASSTRLSTKVTTRISEYIVTNSTTSSSSIITNNCNL